MANVYEGLPKSFGVILHFGTEEDVTSFKKLKNYLERNPDDVDALVEFGALCSVVFEGPRDAELALIRAIEFDPTSIEAYYWLGRTYLWDCSYEERAKWALEKAVSLDDKNFDTQCLLAHSFTYSFDREVGLAVEYVKENPTYVAAYVNLGHSLLHNNDIEGAILALKEASIAENVLEKKRFYTRRTEKFYEEFMENLGYTSGLIYLNDAISEKKSCQRI
ncbi:tetratricopeptide repeat protein [Candidatus Dependentiae bacterium]